MKIEDCKTVPEFFGVNIHDNIWVEGKRFKVYRDALGGEQSAPNEASRALVGCLTGQLKWSKHEPITASKDSEFDTEGTSLSAHFDNLKKVTLVGRLTFETTSDMRDWSAGDVEQWALNHLQNLSLEVFDWEVILDD